MRGRTTPPRWEALTQLAERQGGVVGRAQLVALGVHPKTIDYRVRQGLLLVVHPGVYALGHRSLRREGWWWAALLACGAGAVLSHFTAAAAWDLLPGREKIHVSVPGRTGPLRLKGVVAHRPRLLPAEDVATREGLGVTTVARTLVDLAAVAREPTLERAVEEAEHHRLFDLVAVQAVLAGSKGRRGIRRLREVISRWAGPNASRSDMEVAFRALCRAAGVPQPLTNAPIALGDGHYEPDFLWPDRRLIIETDGFDAHSSKAAFARDRRRDRRLRRLGYAVERFTWEDIFFDPIGCTAEIADIVERNPSRPIEVVWSDLNC